MMPRTPWPPIIENSLAAQRNHDHGPREGCGELGLKKKDAA